MKPLRAPHLAHRLPGYALLSGEGIEIGALHQPASLPSGARVRFCDVLSKQDSAHLFPELNPNDLVDVDVIVDLDRSGLGQFSDDSCDFAILNHVIEHLANPVAAIAELFRVVRSGGKVVLSAPDKDYTFDRPREITPFSHVLTDYRAGTTEICDEHYLDFLYAVKPDARDENAAQIRSHLESLRRRREHAHVWDSAAFSDFLEQSFALLEINAKQMFETTGAINRFEHFSVWLKP
jgi:SAM-dependent methyltransferase